MTEGYIEDHFECLASKYARMCVPLLHLVGSMSEGELGEALGVDIEDFSDSYWVEFSVAMRKCGAAYFVEPDGFHWEMD